MQFNASETRLLGTINAYGLSLSEARIIVTRMSSPVLSLQSIIFGSALAQLWLLSIKLLAILIRYNSTKLKTATAQKIFNSLQQQWLRSACTFVSDHLHYSLWIFLYFIKGLFVSQFVANHKDRFYCVVTHCMALIIYATISCVV